MACEAGGKERKGEGKWEPKNEEWAGVWAHTESFIADAICLTFPGLMPAYMYMQYIYIYMYIAMRFVFVAM